MLTNTRPVAPPPANTAEVSPRMPIRVWVGVVGLATVLALVALVTLTSQQVDAGKEGAVAWVLNLLHSSGVPSWFGYRELEFAANIVMFVPLGFFAGLIVSLRAWPVVFVLPLATSVVIELTQLFLLPMRVASLTDVVANTAGGWVGATLALAIRAMSAKGS